MSESIATDIVHRVGVELSLILIVAVAGICIKFLGFNTQPHSAVAQTLEILAELWVISDSTKLLGIFIVAFEPNLTKRWSFSNRTEFYIDETD